MARIFRSVSHSQVNTRRARRGSFLSGATAIAGMWLLTSVVATDAPIAAAQNAAPPDAATEIAEAEVTAVQDPAGPENPGRDTAGAADALADRVRQLARQLDARSAEDRDAAEAAIIELGPDALSHLPQVNERTAAEMKVRLERIMNTLEKELAASAALPSKVTMSGAMTVAEALEAIQEQTGNAIIGGRDKDQSVTLDEDQAGFWPALDRLLDSGELAIEPYGGNERALTLVARGEGVAGRYGYADYQGPFRFEATRIQASRDLRNPSIQGLRVHLEMSWEPRLAPISVGFPFSDIRATDDQDRQLTIENVDVRPTYPVQAGISIVEVDLPFALPDRDVRALKSVEGTCELLMPGRVETFEFPPLGGAQETQLRRAGVVVVLEGLRKNQDLYEVRMRVEFDDAANALESHLGWISNNEAYLLDEQGTRIENLGHKTTRQEANALGRAYLFEMKQPPQSYRFVYRTPALILRRSIPFKLQNIELP